MRRMICTLSLTLIVSAAALAQGGAEVYCGSFVPFRFRVAAQGKDPQARANQAMDVINKYLGGKSPRVSVRADRQAAMLEIQREVVAVVTADDARAERARGAQQLAQIWSKKLTLALQESCAQK